MKIAYVEIDTLLAKYNFCIDLNEAIDVYKRQVTYFGNNTLKDVFDYEPVQKDWKPEYESLLMGVQACMWTEFCLSLIHILCKSKVCKMRA